MKRKKGRTPTNTVGSLPLSLFYVLPSFAFPSSGGTTNNRIVSEHSVANYERSFCFFVQTFSGVPQTPCVRSSLLTLAVVPWGTA